MACLTIRFLWSLAERSVVRLWAVQQDLLRAIPAQTQHLCGNTVAVFEPAGC